MPSGVFTLAEIQQVISADPQQWKPIVFTNGCFDLIHAGHVRYLTTAKSFGRSLIVGLNSDRSVQQIKPSVGDAPARPIVPEAQRAEVLAALKPVDAVVIFEETTASTLISELQPDVYVKGGDYQVETLPEAPEVHAYGGQIQLVKIEVPSSTTAILQQILKFFP